MPRNEEGALARVRGVVAQSAPALAAALGGPLAGAAAEALRRALSNEDDDRPLDEVILAGAPATLLALRRAEHDFRSAMAEAENEAERIAASDRADARAREVAVRDRTPAILAACVIAGFFGVLAVMLFRVLPEQAEPAFSIMLGALATMTAAVVNYYFGSSAGSKAKTDLLRRLP
ncbi:hypothetical protein [Parvularcula dongshanensis]|uniref:Uncharacterized protein n=1 Tax=Parvularcula dongshanensis TaxID=1173995 RepID=A0A840I0E9_9PROT|nr:hypothetical protein [Parvularcula dongshanensis]MBB4657761.1 hypothetical protein [Parvularcula dongshanensis]